MGRFTLLGEAVGHPCGCWDGTQLRGLACRGLGRADCGDFRTWLHGSACPSVSAHGGGEDTNSHGRMWLSAVPDAMS